MCSWCRLVYLINAYVNIQLINVRRVLINLQTPDGYKINKTCYINTEPFFSCFLTESYL